MTVYEVILSFWEDLFPVGVWSAYADIFELLSVVLTILLIMEIIVLPLYKLATFFFRKK